MRIRTPQPAASRTRIRPSQATALHYTERVNRAIDYIITHLTERLRLQDVARAAHLSPFHFHRVFQAIMGVTLADFIKRRRLDHALGLMAQPRRRSLTTIAHASGFSSSSDFSRSFKQAFGASPTSFDLAAWQRTHRAELEAIADPTRLHRTKLPRVANPDRFRVKIIDLPARTVAYIRVRDPYKPGKVFAATQRLIEWARERCIADHQWLGYQWDNPELTGLAHCQYYIAVEADIAPRGEIGRFAFPPMTVAQIDIKGDIHQELRALQWFYASWLPSSGCVPDDQPGFEAWNGLPFAHGQEWFELRAQMPIRRP